MSIEKEYKIVFLIYIIIMLSLFVFAFYENKQKENMKNMQINTELYYICSNKQHLKTWKY